MRELTACLDPLPHRRAILLDVLLLLSLEHEGEGLDERVREALRDVGRAGEAHRHCLLGHRFDVVGGTSAFGKVGDYRAELP